MDDYFSLFGLERRLALDPADLQQRFYKLSRELHPDRFARAAPAERERSAQASATLNAAYRALRDPAARAEYFLKLAGAEPGRGGGPAELLEEIFELNAALEGAHVSAQIEAARARLTGLAAETDRRLAELFPEYDRSGDAAVLAEIRLLVERRKYLQKIASGRAIEP